MEYEKVEYSRTLMTYKEQTVRINCLLVVETWECINQLFGHAKQHIDNAVK